MSAGRELVQIDQWLRETLAAGTALAAMIGGTANPRIFSALAPQNAPLPFLLYDVQESRDDSGVAGYRGCVQTDYVVRAVTEGPGFASAAQIMAEADPLIHQRDGTVYSGTVPTFVIAGCVRLNEVRYIEVENGVRYNHVGAAYRIWGREP